MSARLELQPLRYFDWKGKTFNQITSALKENTYTLNDGDNRNIFNPHPVKLYRREIASTTITSGNPRTSTSIDAFNMPGGTSIVADTNCTSLANTLDINQTTNKYDLGEAIQLSSEPAICFSQADNARRRLRSGGMIKKYDINNRKSNYYTSSSQYLYDRNQTYDQNQFTRVVSDTSCSDPTQKPSNQRFYVQGGVSSSDLTARKKYEEITSAAATYTSAYGTQVANALAYGAHDTSYTTKEKMGYPLKKTPVFSKYTNEMKQCYVTTIANKI